MHRILISVLTLLLPVASIAQLSPAEGAKLNYRLIGFRVPGSAATGTIEIAEGNHTTDESFGNKKIASVACTAGKAIAEVPRFGAEYTWRMAPVKAGSAAAAALHHFTTLTSPLIDTAVSRLRVISNAGNYKDGFVLLDHNKVIYDMAGNPVWFLPSVDGLPEEPVLIRDLKPSGYGTLTLLLNDWPYEINYEGDVLWKAPHLGQVSGDSLEHFHHEVTRLKNGNYMAMGTELLPWDRKGPLDQKRSPRLDSKTGLPEVTLRPAPKAPFTTLMEYDAAGKLVWWWKSAKYYRDTDGYFERPQSPLYDPHANAFYFDEKKKTIVISLKNINQIMKIKYPEGTVLNAYGTRKGVPGHMPSDLFCDQHGLKVTAAGNLFVYNNNICNIGQYPKIVMLKEPANAKDTLKKIWEFDCPILDDQKFPDRKSFVTNGGNVMELPDNTLFASMCLPYANVFIVNMDKQIRWSAVPEAWSLSDKRWQPFSQYRATIITSTKEMEKLIFNTRK